MQNSPKFIRTDQSSKCVTERAWEYKDAKAVFFLFLEGMFSVRVCRLSGRQVSYQRVKTLGLLAI